MGATSDVASDWSALKGGFPRNVGPDEKLAFALKCALVASETICWPSWDCRITDSVAELLAKDFPLAEAMDHEGRQTMLGCGVSLQLFKLTLRRLGCLGRVELFPDLDRPTLAARIHIGHGGERDKLESRLVEVIGPDRLPAPLPGELLSFETVAPLLQHAAEEERGWLEFARNASTRERLHTLAIQSQSLVVEEIRLRNVRASALSGHQRESRKAGDDSLFKRFSRWKRPQLVVKLARSPAPGHGPGGSPPPPALPGAFAALKTKTDDKYGWLAAGQAMARVILQSRVSGVSCTLHNESLRAAHVRAALRTEIGRKGFVQGILRFGLESQYTSVEPVVACQRAPAIDQSTSVFAP